MSNPNIDLTDIAVWAQGEYLFVELVPQPDVSPSGLAIPASDFQIGKVISAGAEAIDKLVGPLAEFQPDDYLDAQVIFQKTAGMAINTPEPHKFLHYKEIFAVLEPEEG